MKLVSMFINFMWFIFLNHNLVSRLLESFHVIYVMFFYRDILICKLLRNKVFVVILLSHHKIILLLACRLAKAKARQSIDK